MFQHFESLIRPLLDATRRLRTIVEVGADYGEHTSKLLPYVRSRRAHLHIIDPVPHRDLTHCQRQYASCSTLHQALSRDVLPSLDAPDVVLLDGDHNWYTVLEELRILDRSYADWPLTFTHDVDWPYGRRDMYYAPERVPDDCRQPFSPPGLGIVRGSSELSRQGINREHWNAMHEGGPRNGVLTAIEDFLDETQRHLVFFVARGHWGLGIIVDRSRLHEQRFAKALRRVHDPRAAMALSPHHASTRPVMVPRGLLRA
jgi:methyltransferase family protein